MTETSVQKLQAMNGKLFEPSEFWPGMFPIFRVDANTKAKLNEVNEQIKRKAPTPKVVGEGPMVAFSARGYVGQYLVVVPRHRIVAVRKRRSPENHDPNDFRGEFVDFEAMVRTLVK